MTWMRWPFQLTAARRRLGGLSAGGFAAIGVSTHSRPKAAGRIKPNGTGGGGVSTHSRPKAAGERFANL